MNAQTAIIPQPRCVVKVRAAGSNDLAFIDQLQKLHTHMVGFFPRKQMEGYLAMGAVQVATDDEGRQLGYIVSRDEYSGRDDVGMIYQINVEPIRHRHLIGAMLVKAAFEKAAYGCKLFSCWCAQDIAANWFWEALGFVPLAFRTGTRSKQRTHIFWQKRIREGDNTTPWWFPFQTKSGAFREDRLAFPIPPGVHWRDPMPIVIPELKEQAELPRTLPGGARVRPRPPHTILTRQGREEAQKLGTLAVVTSAGIKVVQRPDYKSANPLYRASKAGNTRRTAKHDPKHIQLARELRDRFLDQVNGDAGLLLPSAKYEVARAALPPAPDAAAGPKLIEVKALPEAA